MINKILGLFGDNTDVSKTTFEKKIEERMKILASFEGNIAVGKTTFEKKNRAADENRSIFY